MCHVVVDIDIIQHCRIQCTSGMLQSRLRRCWVCFIYIMVDCLQIVLSTYHLLLLYISQFHWKLDWVLEIFCDQVHWNSKADNRQSWVELVLLHCICFILELVADQLELGALKQQGWQLVLCTNVSSSYMTEQCSCFYFKKKRTSGRSAMNSKWGLIKQEHKN